MSNAAPLRPPEVLPRGRVRGAAPTGCLAGTFSQTWAEAGLPCSPRLLGGRQPGLACSLLCDVRISPGPAPFLLLRSDPSTNVFLIAGDRAEGGEESVGRSGHEGLGGTDVPHPPLQLPV